MEHAVKKIVQLITEERNDRRAILQIGYNLGRLSEITRRGREPFWDKWKEPIDAWDLPRLKELAKELEALLEAQTSRCVPDTPGSA